MDIVINIMGTVIVISVAVLYAAVLCDAFGAFK